MESHFSGQKRPKGGLVRANGIHIPRPTWHCGLHSSRDQTSDARVYKHKHKYKWRTYVSQIHKTGNVGNWITMRSRPSLVSCVQPWVPLFTKTGCRGCHKVCRLSWITA
ncbi:hypothetical protein E4U43_002167 [Claviceps pusilla]|uniref:Uncharacterized protein n=1 Tax=Claviceps pusilla TaxID=123648 RepID=A0A9P7N8Q0_9HYPO|nr:hypothetical protein E4U43_002167 [Claviceps pusilla]